MTETRDWTECPWAAEIKRAYPIVTDGDEEDEEDTLWLAPCGEEPRVQQLRETYKNGGLQSLRTALTTAGPQGKWCTDQGMRIHRIMEQGCLAATIEADKWDWSGTGVQPGGAPEVRPYEHQQSPLLAETVVAADRDWTTGVPPGRALEVSHSKKRTVPQGWEAPPVTKVPQGWEAPPVTKVPQGWEAPEVRPRKYHKYQQPTLLAEPVAANSNGHLAPLEGLDWVGWTKEQCQSIGSKSLADSCQQHFARSTGSKAHEHQQPPLLAEPVVADNSRHSAPLEGWDWGKWTKEQCQTIKSESLANSCKQYFAHPSFGS